MRAFKNIIENGIDLGSDTQIQVIDLEPLIKVIEKFKGLKYKVIPIDTQLSRVLIYTIDYRK